MKTSVRSVITGGTSKSP